MNKFFGKNLGIVLLAINGYFLFSISNSLKEVSKYNSDLRACAAMKAHLNDKDLSIFFKENASSITNISIKFIDEYFKKLNKQNLF